MQVLWQEIPRKFGHGAGHLREGRADCAKDNFRETRVEIACRWSLPLLKF